MRLILDRTKLDSAKESFNNKYPIINLPFELCEIRIEYNDNRVTHINEYVLGAMINNKFHELYWNSDKQLVLNEYNKLTQAYYNGERAYTFTWN